MKSDLVIIGAGPAGLAAAAQAYKEGVRDILLLERDNEPGGILNQCIHNGFGLHIYKEELTGPEYAERAFRELDETSVRFMPDTMVLSVSPDRRISAVSRTEGLIRIEAGSVILAMGCRERTRGAISIPGDRPSGILTAGAAQRYVNIEGCMVGRRVVLLGSGDIGLIMARRMTLEGARVLACVELMPFSGGLTRNIVQCLQDYDIPLLLSHTITGIRGRKRLEAVTVSKVDESLRPIPGTETELDCDTLLLSVGLIPENELSRGAGVELDPRTGGPTVTDDTQTSVPGIFACGNVLHVHDLVDNVTLEARKAGRAAARFLFSATREDIAETKDVRSSKKSPDPSARPVLRLTSDENILYTVPQAFSSELSDQTVDIYFRVKKILRDCDILLVDPDGTVLRRVYREYMTPGEMEKLTLSSSMLTARSARSLTLTIRPGEETSHD
ncbi:MAG: FAD-dependent oxidoreductase [Clostridiaceae bacterium]|nr:FAD-dependent oxidoreductase [Clostridiaceae bacterium]